VQPIFAEHFDDQIAAEINARELLKLPTMLVQTSKSVSSVTPRSL
jgi:hypothetical protein